MTVRGMTVRAETTGSGTRGCLAKTTFRDRRDETLGRLGGAPLRANSGPGPQQEARHVDVHEMREIHEG